MSLASVKAGPVRWALKESIPVFMGYIPLGMVYGFLFVQAGAEWWMAPLASMLIYGGRRSVHDGADAGSGASCGNDCHCHAGD